MIIDTRSGNIQVQGEYNVVVESEPVTITGQSFPERQEGEAQRIINSMEQKDPVEHYDSKPVFDIIREVTEQEEEPPEDETDQEDECDADDHPEINALQTQNYPKKRWRPKKHIEPDIKAKDDTDEKTYNGKTIRSWYWTRKAAWAPTPVVDFTRVNKIPFQAFMDKKREIEKE